MTTLDIVSAAAALADDVDLDVMGPADLSDGAQISIRFTMGAAVFGKWLD